MRPAAGARIAQPDRLHRAEAQRVEAARRHDFDRQAALEIRRPLLPLMEFGLVPGQQCGDEGLVFGLVERTVYVIRDTAAWPFLIVARLKPGLVKIDRVAMDDGGDRVEE